MVDINKYCDCKENNKIMNYCYQCGSYNRPNLVNHIDIINKLDKYKTEHKFKIKCYCIMKEHRNNKKYYHFIVLAKVNVGERTTCCVEPKKIDMDLLAINNKKEIMEKILEKENIKAEFGIWSQLIGNW